MQINKLKIDIENLYITKPLEKETFLKVLKENHNTIHSLYLITNELKSRHDYLSVDDHPDYIITAYIMVYHGYLGKSKEQIGVLKSMKSKLRQRPFFNITYKIIDRKTYKEEFVFKHSSTNKDEIYKLIDKFYKKTQELCKINMF